MNIFGSGLMFGTPLLNAAGAAVANPTPLLFGVLQESEVEFKFDLKKLYGQSQFPVAVGRGQGSVSGKAKWADIYAAALETLVFGIAGTSGLTAAVYDTVGATIPSSPFTITPTVPNSGTWQADLGVISVATGRPFTRVASAPAAGQYSVAAGVYTFAAADTGQSVYINYRYTATSTVARRVPVTNQPMGLAPSFRLDLYTTFQGESCIITLNNCISDGLKMSNKNDDFTVPEFSFEAFADAGGNIGTIALAE
jgi:hypothetical protein